MTARAAQEGGGDGAVAEGRPFRLPGTSGRPLQVDEGYSSARISPRRAGVADRGGELVAAVRVARIRRSGPRTS